MVNISLTLSSNKIIMKENISRREFFKKAVKVTLPILGAAILPKIDLLANNSVSKAETPQTCYGSSCIGLCTTTCHSGCKGGCGETCTGSCKDQCGGNCSGSCKSI